METETHGSEEIFKNEGAFWNALTSQERNGFEPRER